MWALSFQRYTPGQAHMYDGHEYINSTLKALSRFLISFVGLDVHNAYSFLDLDYSASFRLAKQFPIITNCVSHIL